MKTYHKINEKLMEIIKYVIGVMLFFTVVFIFLQVIFRYILNRPLNWTEQTSRFLFIWMIMLAGPVVFFNDGAMAFDLVLKSVNAKIRYFLELFIIILFLVFYGYYLYQACYLAMKSKGRYTTGVRVPLVFMYSSMIISNVFVLSVMFEKFLSKLLSIKTVLKHEDTGKEV